VQAARGCSQQLNIFDLNLGYIRDRAQYPIKIIVGARFQDDLHFCARGAGREFKDQLFQGICLPGCLVDKV
jgi:hypothetical protein